MVTHRVIMVLLSIYEPDLEFVLSYIVIIKSMIYINLHSSFVNCKFNLFIFFKCIILSICFKWSEYLVRRRYHMHRHCYKI